MKKDYLKRLFIFALTLTSISLFAQNRQIIVNKEYTDKNNVTLVTEKQSSVTLKFNVNELNLIEVDTDYGKMYKIESDKAPHILEVGQPDLLYIPAAIIIPDTGSIELEITYGEYQEIENIEIAPSKGSIERSIDPATLPYYKGEVYEINDFFPAKGAVANEPFIMRDVRGQTIFAYPVQYNPVTKTLRVYSEITVTAIYTEKQGINEFTNQKRHKSIDSEFNSMYSRLFLNHSVIQQKNYPTSEEGELLIICHPPYMEAMKPFVDWKRTTGRKTTLVSTSETGIYAASIGLYISKYYKNPENNLSHVLLVGDSQHIPAHTAPNSYSDILYGQIIGNDAFVEVLIGRMSAETIEHVETQVQRSIWYERDITTDDTWLNQALGISTNEPGASEIGHDGGENDFEHINNIRDRLLNYGYNPVYQEYGSGTNVPTTTAALISQRFNEGVGVANYCNHGSEGSWTMTNGNGTLYYSISHIDELTNTGKLPYIFSVACLCGRFMHIYQCMAEGWLRATHENQPTGAVAVYMPTLNQRWGVPMTAQDEFANVCMEIPSIYGSPESGINRTIAGAMINSAQKMLLVWGSGVGYAARIDFDAWCVFGDPTLMYRTKAPQEMTVSHPFNMEIGMSSLTVICDTDGALAAITYIDENENVIILGKAKVVNGTAEIIFAQPLLATEDLTLTITGKDRVTYQSQISVNYADHPYIILKSYNISGAPEFGKTIGLNFELNNVSNSPYTASNVTVKVTSESQFVSVSDESFTLGVIEAGQFYTCENKIFVDILENVPNNELIVLNLLITCEYGGEEYNWETTASFVAFASDIEIGEIYLENKNGTRISRYTANSDAILIVNIKNTGNFNLFKTNVAISTASEYLSINQNIETIYMLGKDNTAKVEFVVKVGDAPTAIPASLVVRVSSDACKDNKIYTNSIGTVSSYTMTNGNVNTQFANFYDSGGSGNAYSQNENYTLIIKPVTADKKITVRFSEFNTEENNDILYIYDGLLATDELLIAELSGSQIPQDYTATNYAGALTFKFKSNSYIQLLGWAAIVYETNMFYNVSFVITDDYDNPVTDAIITFDGYELAKNQFIVPLVAAGTYTYSVEKEGYETKRGTINVENKDEELPIKFSNLSIENNELSEFYVYPNPFNDIIYLGGNSSLINKVYISNMLGQRVKEINLNGKSSFTTNNLPIGVYMMIFEKKDGKFETVKMIKQ